MKVPIYQNSDHVAGLVQQIFNAPLIKESVVENHQDKSANDTAEGKASANVDVQLSIPMVKGGGGADLEGRAAYETGIATGSRSTQSFVYSQAYYLNLLHSALNDRKLIRTIENTDDVESLKVGDFVEYQSVFDPSELTTIMDVVSPELIGEILRNKYTEEETAIFMQRYDEGLEQGQIAMLGIQERTNARRDLGISITTAIRSDFRRDKTREYYGTIRTVDETTAITICDSAHFVVDDEDRILDGVFSVLGKVSSEVETDVPILARNKLLRFIDPEAYDTIVEEIDNLLNSRESIQIGDAEIENFLKLKLRSRIEGKSFKVIPIAIWI